MSSLKGSQEVSAPAIMKIARMVPKAEERDALLKLFLVLKIMCEGDTFEGQVIGLFTGDSKQNFKEIGDNVRSWLKKASPENMQFLDNYLGMLTSFPSEHTPICLAELKFWKAVTESVLEKRCDLEAIKDIDPLDYKKCAKTGDYIIFLCCQECLEQEPSTSMELKFYLSVMKHSFSYIPNIKDVCEIWERPENFKWLPDDVACDLLEARRGLAELDKTILFDKECSAALKVINAMPIKYLKDKRATLTIPDGEKEYKTVDEVFSKSHSKLEDNLMAVAINNLLSGLTEEYAFRHRYCKSFKQPKKATIQQVASALGSGDIESFKKVAGDYLEDVKDDLEEELQLLPPLVPALESLKMFRRGKEVTDGFDEALKSLEKDRDQSVESIINVASKFCNSSEVYIDEYKAVDIFMREKDTKAGDDKLESDLLQMWKFINEGDVFLLKDSLREVLNNATLAKVRRLLKFIEFCTPKLKTIPDDFDPNESSETSQYRLFLSQWKFFKAFLTFLSKQSEKEIKRFGAKFNPEDMDLCGVTGEEELVNICFEIIHLKYFTSDPDNLKAGKIPEYEYARAYKAFFEALPDKLLMEKVWAEPNLVPITNKALTQELLIARETLEKNPTVPKISYEFRKVINKI